MDLWSAPEPCLHEDASRNAIRRRTRRALFSIVVVLPLACVGERITEPPPLVPTLLIVPGGGAPGASGDAAPVRTISGANTSLFSPTGMALDNAGRLHVSNYIGATITVYAAGATGDVTPLRIITGPNTKLDHPGNIIF